ncbi:molybdate ABC transporter substrate-binding protein [Pedococcus sp. NPDC057267]|uniref:molybdate ABC transporter substrate-binding protein n=1 Tax=Pedococcus sp. NPDC057267 TaxID=3346077 RepID=UPI00364403D0
MRAVTRRLVLPVVVVLAASTAACGSGAAQGGGSSGDASAGGAPAGGASGAASSGGRLSGTLTVFAAASLKKPFTQIGAQFEKAHPGTRVTFSFAGSSDLVAQIQQGAPADVFASADERNMAKATADSLTAGTPVAFATNTLEIAVPPGNPGRVTSLRDLARPGLKVVVCAPAVPCGGATAKVEAAARVDLKPVSEEQSVTDVLGKVSAGEADAGLVYVTDVKGAGGSVQGVPFAESSAAVNTYPVAALKTSRNPALAAAFVQAVTGELGQSALAAAGFGKP